MNIKDRIGKTYWFDLPTLDPVNARSFYEGLFRWKFLLMNESPVPDYWVIQAGDELIGGLRKISSEKPAQPVPTLYFTVDDIRFYSQQIKDLGGKLIGDIVNLGKGRGHYQWFEDREKNRAALWAPSKESL